MDLISYALAKKALDVANNSLKISDIEIIDGELVVSLTTGEQINAGKIPAADLEALKNLEEQLEELKNNVISPDGSILTNATITLSADPTEDLQAATKKYVDNKIISRNTSKGFPKVGLVDVIYKAEKEKKLYQWNPDSQEYEVLCESSTSGIENIQIINGGKSNGRN